MPEENWRILSSWEWLHAPRNQKRGRKDVSGRIADPFEGIVVSNGTFHAQAMQQPRNSGQEVFSLGRYPSKSADNGTRELESGR